MNHIFIFVYSYKNKNLYQTIFNIINNASNKNKITIFLYDQNNANRKKQFRYFENVIYKHIEWFNTLGKSYFRKQAMGYAHDYYLEINDTITLPKLWDILLFKFLSESDIVSGKNLKNIKINNFTYEITETPSKQISKSGWIDTDLFFTHKSNLVYIENINFLKGKIEEFLFSAIYLNNDKKIVSLANNFYNINNIEHDYLPYSKMNNYNKFIDIGNKIGMQKLENFYNISFNLFKKKKYENNDVTYNSYTIEIDNMENTRFHKKINNLKLYDKIGNW